MFTTALALRSMSELRNDDTSGERGRGGKDVSYSEVGGFDMPDILPKILITVVSAVMLVAGLWMLILPDAAAKKLKEISEDATPEQARRNARVTGIVLLVFAWAGLLVLVQGLKPFPPGENGLGF